MTLCLHIGSYLTGPASTRNKNVVRYRGKPVVVATIDYSMLLKWNLVQEADDLVVQLLPVKNKLLQLLNNPTMSDEIVNQLVLLFAKVVSNQKLRLK